MSLRQVALVILLLCGCGMCWLDVGRCQGTSIYHCDGIFWLELKDCKDQGQTCSNGTCVRPK